MGIASKSVLECFVREMCTDLKQRIEKAESNPQAVLALKEFGIHIIGSSSRYFPDVLDERRDEWAQEYLELFRG